MLRCVVQQVVPDAFVFKFKHCTCIAWSWRRRHQDPSKDRELLTKGYSVNIPEDLIETFRHIALRTSNLASLYLFCLWDVKNLTQAFFFKCKMTTNLQMLTKVQLIHNTETNEMQNTVPRYFIWQYHYEHSYMWKCLFSTFLHVSIPKESSSWNHIKATPQKTNNLCKAWKGVKESNS